MSCTRIAVVGAGVHAIPLIEALADRLTGRAVDLRLFARRVDRAQLVAAQAAQAIDRCQPAWRIRATDSLGEAVEGATVAVVAVRIGGHAARAWDEQFPARHGSVGDEGLGLGGLANAWRSQPVLQELAATLRASAPSCRVANMVAPLGLTTRLLCDAGLDAVGLCELPLLTQRGWALGADDPNAVVWHYLGFNHLGWTWPASAAAHQALERAVANRTVDGPTLARFGAAPLWYHYAVVDQQAGARLGIAARPGRASWLGALADRAIADMAGGNPKGARKVVAQRPTPWFDQMVAPTVAAWLGRAAFSGHVNTQPAPDWLNIPKGVVVETAAQFDATGTGCCWPRDVPEQVLSFLAEWGRYEDLAYAAVCSRDVTQLAAAVRALPLPFDRNEILAIVRDIVQGESLMGQASASPG
ncbi:MAG: hypothetical protein FJ100_22935 [Deltaproteobacteria bacterium]|nr:hypothetical protein [Deltaproteobacteria bacterium]